jgi:hypothetical protein
MSPVARGSTRRQDLASRHANDQLLRRGTDVAGLVDLDFGEFGEVDVHGSEPTRRILARAFHDRDVVGEKLHLQLHPGAADFHQGSLSTEIRDDPHLAPEHHLVGRHELPEQALVGNQRADGVVVEQEPVVVGEQRVAGSDSIPGRPGVLGESRAERCLLRVADESLAPTGRRRREQDGATEGHGDAEGQGAGQCGRDLGCMPANGTSTRSTGRVGIPWSWSAVRNGQETDRV